MSLAALVVDDNFFNRDLARLALENVGFIVSEAEDGAAALEMLTEHEYAVIVLDLAMPMLDGRAVLSKIKQQNLNPSMTIIVMTANAHMTDSYIDNNADFVLHKPMAIEALVNLLKRIYAAQS